VRVIAVSSVTATHTVETLALAVKLVTLRATSNESAVAAVKFMRPIDHRGFWVRRHAALADFDDELAPVKRTCSTCHGAPGLPTLPPHEVSAQPHSPVQSPHPGAVASFDPSPCRVCHQEASCCQCHRRTPPLNHRGAWRTLHGFAAGGFGDSNCYVATGELTAPFVIEPASEH